MNHEDTRSTDRPEVPRWVKVLLYGLLIALGAALLFLVIKAARKGGAGALIAAVPAAAVAVAARKRSIPKPQISQDLLRRHLEEVAAHETLITPTDLYDRLFRQGVQFGSAQQMAHELGLIELRSQVRSVSGRSERRWYDLSTLVGRGENGQDSN